jgi:hypothetical protein
MRPLRTFNSQEVLLDLLGGLVTLFVKLEQI